MAKFKLGEEEIDIPKFKFREIKAAAPFIDRVIARRKKLSALGDNSASREEVAEKLTEMGAPMETMIETLSDIVRIIAVGVLHARQERPYSVASIEAQAELIEGEIDIDDFSAINAVFDDIAREAGMLRPNPPKPPPEGGAKDPPGSELTE